MNYKDFLLTYKIIRDLAHDNDSPSLEDTCTEMIHTIRGKIKKKFSTVIINDDHAEFSDIIIRRDGYLVSNNIGSHNPSKEQQLGFIEIKVVKLVNL
ncbi:hypothetical protein [Salmonella phage SD-6_S16]|nr:hypothetical protein [Salmonella phage SD-6_S16]